MKNICRRRVRLLNSETEDRRIKLIKEMKKLAHGKGIQRENLREFLQDRAPELTRALRVDVSQDEKIVRNSLESALYSLIIQVPPRVSRDPFTVEQRKTRYVVFLCTGFNLNTMPEVRNLKLSDRQEWLAMPERGPLQVAERTSRRALEDGILSLATMLSGEPFTPDQTPVVAADLAQLAGSPELGAETSQSAVRHKSWYSKRSTLSAAGVIAVMLLVGGITFAAGGFDGFNGEGKAGAPSENGAQPSSPSSTAASAKAPYELTVRTNIDEFTNFGRPMSYYFEKEIGQIPAPPAESTDCNRKHKWAHENGGVDLGQSAVQVSLYSRTDPIHILGARVEVVERLKPKPGVAISCGQGSPVEERHVMVKVNSQATIEYRPNGVLNPEPFAFEIKPGSNELLGIWALLGGSAVEEDFRSGFKWKIILSVTIDGKAQDIVIDDNGKPFVIYGEPEGTPRYRWRDGQWKKSGL